jgi:hypothetical protein
LSDREFLRERGVCFAAIVCAAEAIAGLDDDREIKQRRRSDLDDVEFNPGKDIGWRK